MLGKKVREQIVSEIGCQIRGEQNKCKILGKLLKIKRKLPSDRFIHIEVLAAFYKNWNCNQKMMRFGCGLCKKDGDSSQQI